jgi:RNA polymerase sigma-70 factor (ECF subfamily)
MKIPAFFESHIAYVYIHSCYNAIGMSASRNNQVWLKDLSAEGELQTAAIADLRNILLQAAIYFFGRNLGDLQGLSREEIIQRAEDCAQDALIAVMDHLSEFRGDSKFTTWAYKFAINKAMMAARHERWKGFSLDELAEVGGSNYSEWIIQDRSDGITPEQSAIQSELQATIRTVIEQDLTEKQRQVLLLMVFNEVPMDEVVLRLETNRNSVYKLLHDARRKLKAKLVARGIEVGEILNYFGAVG